MMTDYTLSLCSLFSMRPGDCKVSGSMPSTISCCCCCFLKQGTLLSLLQTLPSCTNGQISPTDTTKSSVTSPEGAIHSPERSLWRGYHKKVCIDRYVEYNCQRQLVIWYIIVKFISACVALPESSL